MYHPEWEAFAGEKTKLFPTTTGLKETTRCPLCDQKCAGSGNAIASHGKVYSWSSYNVTLRGLIFQLGALSRWEMEKLVSQTLLSKHQLGYHWWLLKSDWLSAQWFIHKPKNVFTINEKATSKQNKQSDFKACLKWSIKFQENERKKKKFSHETFLVLNVGGRWEIEF